MGLLDDLGKAVGGALQGQQAQGSQAGGGAAALVPALLSMLGNGGLERLLAGFQQQGLGQLVGSWISTGPNQPASPAQIEQGLGRANLDQLARQTGLEPGAVASQLSSILPGLVDKLTPDGAVPKGDALEKGMALLKGLL